MADEKPIQNVPEDESKKDTVRINLPQGGPRPLGAAPTPTVRLKPAPAPAAVGGSAIADDESKKETAVMGMPATLAKPKKDTSRVQVPAAKPGVPEMPRPTVKLKREETSPIAAPAAAAPAPQPVAPPMAVAPAASGLDVGLAIAAMVLALAVAGYLFSLSGS